MEVCLLLYLSIPCSHHVSPILKGEQMPSRTVSCLIMLHLPCQDSPPPLPSFGPASCCLVQALWRQVRSTALSPCKSTNNAILSSPPPLTLPLSVPFFFHTHCHSPLACPFMALCSSPEQGCLFNAEENVCQWFVPQTSSGMSSEEGVKVQLCTEEQSR